MLVKVGSNRIPVRLSVYTEDVLADRDVHCTQEHNLVRATERTAAAIGRLLEVLIEKNLLSIDDAEDVIGGDVLRIVE